MLKKITIFFVVLTVAFIFVAPIGADPSDVILDEQVTLGVPGSFKLLDVDQNGKAEGIEFSITIKSYKEGNFIINANLEAMKHGQWTAAATTVQPFQWSPSNDRVKLTFYPGNLIKEKLEGVYRVNLSLQDGDWMLPRQVVGFSPEYSWNMFEDKGEIPGEKADAKIASPAEAKRAAETWAELNQIKLGKFLGVSYDYDSWKVEFQPEPKKDRVLQFVVNLEGNVRVLKIDANS